MTALDVALCQYDLGTADSIEGLTDGVRDLLDRAAPADLYVLPELLGNDLRLRGEDTPTAETALTEDERATYHEFLRAEAATRGAVLVGGSYNVESDGTIVNRAPIATPGDFRRYDKCHPTPGEREGGKAPGPADPPIVEHRGVAIGVLICYDVEFPELVRSVVDRGAEVLAVPSWTPTEAGVERVARCAAARAVENQCFVASVPLVGERGDLPGLGRGAVYAPCDDVLGPHGTRLSLPRDEPAAATATVEVGALRTSREAAAIRPYTDYLDGE